MTSNPKSLQNGQHSSPTVLAFGSVIPSAEISAGMVYAALLRKIRRAVFIEIAACLS
jgi:hypothetical protein